ncbi:MAG: type II toxin-antitoxin system prevent-host-death family antitoxin [Gammaproteobacteria bacterium]|nr:type II toxin-antitoxin system prevent-host-death family antitoxin [Gammaproteobacteria bacterium]
MRTVQFVEAKASFSALLAAVEAGEEIAITRHGKVVARIVPDTPRMAADLFRPFWGGEDVDLEAPADGPPEPAPELD